MATPLRCSSISAAFIESRRQGRRRKTVCESEDWRKQSLKAVREIPIAGVLGYLDYETKFEVRHMLWTRLCATEFLPSQFSISWTSPDVPTSISCSFQASGIAKRGNGTQYFVVMDKCVFRVARRTMQPSLCRL